MSLIKPQGKGIQIKSLLLSLHNNTGEWMWVHHHSQFLKIDYNTKKKKWTTSIKAKLALLVSNMFSKNQLQTMNVQYRNVHCVIKFVDCSQNGGFIKVKKE